MDSEKPWQWAGITCVRMEISSRYLPNKQQTCILRLSMHCGVFVVQYDAYFSVNQDWTVKSRARVFGWNHEVACWSKAFRYIYFLLFQPSCLNMTERLFYFCHYRRNVTFILPLFTCQMNEYWFCVAFIRQINAAFRRVILWHEENWRVGNYQWIPALEM